MSEIMAASFGEHIKQRRKELGFPLRKVAAHIDIDTSTLGKIEREERNIPQYSLAKLAEILETNEEELATLYFTSKVFEELTEYL